MVAADERRDAVDDSDGDGDVDVGDRSEMSGDLLQPWD